MASSSGDKSIKLWSIDSQKEVSTLSAHSSSVTSVALSSDGKYLASGSDDKTVKLWSIDSQKELITLKGHSN